MLAFNRIQTIPQLWRAAVTRYRNQPLFKYKTLFNTRAFSYAQADAYLDAFTHFFHKHGVQKGDSILIVGINSPVMAMLMLAAYQQGIVIVPADVRASGELLRKYHEVVKPKLVVCSKWRQREVSAFSQPLLLEDILRLLTPWLGLRPLPKPIIEPSDLAEIMFTSGTTGTPKGVMLTHGNIISNVMDLQPVVPQMPEFNALSILPLSHIFEQVIGLLIPISVGGTIHYVRKTNSVTLKQALQEWPITHLIVVPQVLKNLYRSIEVEVEKQGKKKLFSRMLTIAPRLPMWLRKLLFGQVHRKLGGHIHFIVSAGAKLDPHIGLLWEAMGFPIMEGYGATEVSAAATVNFINNRLIGSVGMPLEHVQLQIEPETKEVLIKSPGVSPGYYKNKEKTVAAFTKDGWYRTGDIGEMRGDRLFLLGRDAFKIVLSSGENVYVEDLESTINQTPEIWESCVIAREFDGREQVHAVIIPAKGYTPTQVADAIDRINEGLEAHQQVVSHSIWPDEDFPRTITQKIDRAALVARLDPVKEEKDSKVVVSTSKADPLLQIVHTIAPRKGVRLKESLNLGADLHMDSIDRVELIALAEDEFGVQIDDYKVTAETTIAEFRKLLVPDPDQKAALTLKAWPFLPWVRLLRVFLLRLVAIPLHMIWISTSITGLEHLRGIRGPAIVLFNHIGLLDVMCYYRYFTFRQLLQISAAATEDFWQKKITSVRFAIELFSGGVPVSPHEKGGARTGLMRIGALLDKGLIVNIAPEGSVTRSGRLNEFKRGAGLLASETGVPVLIVALEGPYQDVFPINPHPQHTQPWHTYVPKLRHRHITIKVSEPYYLADGDPDEVTQFLHEEMERLLK